jgi:probable F420-dependent oxidoreductase
MRFGFLARNMGPEANAATLLEIAEAADSAGLDDLWVVDHIAIPPDDAEGSGGRYLDPLATLAFLAARTQRIRLGTAVLILPYRPALPTAKWVATIQELSGGRLLLGIGAGWMRPEFQVLGVPRNRRGALTDETLELLHRCFSGEVVVENGQAFLFRPLPARPPVYVGGAAPHALERAVRWGDGWMPMVAEPAALREPVVALRERAEAAGKARPEVIAMGALELGDPTRAADQIAAFAEVGVDGFIQVGRYTDSTTARTRIEALAALRESQVA